METLAEKKGLRLEEILDPKKQDSLRMACRFLEIGLDFKGQAEKLFAFLNAFSSKREKLGKDGKAETRIKLWEQPIIYAFDLVALARDAMSSFQAGLDRRGEVSWTGRVAKCSWFQIRVHGCKFI